MSPPEVAGPAAPVLAAATARASWELLSRRAPGGPALWARLDHRGAPVTLLEGPAWALGALVGVLTAPGVAPRVRWAGVLATAGAAAVGVLDDLRGSSGDRGLRGHARALASGRLTTGAVKVAGLGVTGVLAAAVVLGGRAPAGRGHVPGADVPGADVLVAGGVVAGTANLVNLLDLRPGRALKAALLLAVPAAAGRPDSGAGALAAAALGAGAGVLDVDLGGRGMLGDCGANAAGALLGTALVVATGTSRRGAAARAAALAVVVALTAASERVSFTAVIEAHPVLRALDALGRPPRAPGEPPAPG